MVRSREEVLLARMITSSLVAQPDRTRKRNPTHIRFFVFTLQPPWGKIRRSISGQNAPGGFWPRRPRLIPYLLVFFSVADRRNPIGADPQGNEILHSRIGPFLPQGQVYSALPLSSQWPSIRALAAGKFFNHWAFLFRFCLAVSERIYWSNSK